jgi:hypothetical protein
MFDKLKAPHWVPVARHVEQILDIRLPQALALHVCSSQGRHCISSLTGTTWRWLAALDGIKRVQDSEQPCISAGLVRFDSQQLIAELAKVQSIPPYLPCSDNIPKSCFTNLGAPQHPSWHVRRSVFRAVHAHRTRPHRTSPKQPLLAFTHSPRGGIRGPRRHTVTQSYVIYHNLTLFYA